ncbi:hypothetical protein N0V93_000870 [Gnomoniopsis smithogilvyi]|uniref:O-methyltransferase n=1 Tax=Gnomoniopsis smithogilvyi TaxID=1191159 RepID=A0A9W9D1R1_9PEZI|nr:hypothetical protein N0V93_000870 [Gnomoniopsis smithogilvyi]
MQENIAKLYPNPETSAKVMDYSIAHSTPLPEYLVKYHQWGCEETKVPTYLISTYQAQMLIFLARIVGAKKVLELGVYIGFSAMVWSEAVGPSGSVVGLELSEEYAGIARKAFADNKINNVEIKLGDGVASLQTLEPAEAFDLIFVDANKDAYPKYLELILSRSQPGSEKRLLKKGGLIVADNVLRRGIVADASKSNPHFMADLERHGEEASRDFVKALHVFNDALAREERLETFLMPLFDGLGMARLKD